MTKGQMYDAASTILQQKLSQVKGVGQVFVGGSSLPAVRVELNPAALNKYGIGLEDVRAALAATNVKRPKGQLGGGGRTWEIQTNDQLRRAAAQYTPLIIAYRAGARSIASAAWSRSSRPSFRRRSGSRSSSTGRPRSGRRCGMSS